MGRGGVEARGEQKGDLKELLPSTEQPAPPPAPAQGPESAPLLPEEPKSGLVRGRQSAPSCRCRGCDRDGAPHKYNRNPAEEGLRDISNTGQARAWTPSLQSWADLRTCSQELHLSHQRLVFANKWPGAHSFPSKLDKYSAGELKGSP